MDVTLAKYIYLYRMTQKSLDTKRHN